MDRRGRRREKREPVSVDVRTRLCRPDDWLVARADRRYQTDRHPWPLRVGRRGDADLRAVRSVDDLRCRLRAGRVALELSAATAMVGVCGIVNGWTVDDGSDSGKNRSRQFQ